MTTALLEIQAGADGALARARDHLLSLQHPEGWWKGELETNVTMDAEDLLLREFLGIRDAAATERSAAWIRSQQREDGSWSQLLRRPGRPLDDDRGVRRAAAGRRSRPRRRTCAPPLSSCARSAGLQRARVFTHIWLALFGAWPWEQRAGAAARDDAAARVGAAQPLRLRLLGAPDVVVALSVVLAVPPVAPAAVRARRAATAPRRGRRRSAPRRAAGRWSRSTRVLHVYRAPPAATGSAAAGAGPRRALDRRPPGGGRLVGRDPAAVGVLADRAAPARLSARPPGDAARASTGSRRSRSRSRASRRLEACQSPVWDTALAVIALADAGVPGDDEALVRAADWLLDRADPGARRLGGPASARSSRGAGRSSSRTSTTPTSTTPPRSCWRCARVEHPEPRRGSARRSTAALAWVEGMQSSDGGWGAFDADNCRALVRDLPFCDFGEVIDPPSADVTAHAVEMLAAVGRAGRPARRGGDRLAARGPGAATARGSGAGASTTSTAPAPPSRRWSPPGSDRGLERIRRAVRWLEDHQNDDGGWGEDCRSYDDPAWIGRGDSTASQTAWALLALRRRRRALARGSPRRPLAGEHPARRTAAGTSRSSPAPASRPTSTSTTTCTGSCSR